MSDITIERLARKLAAMQAQMGGLMRTQQVARTVVGGVPVEETLAQAGDTAGVVDGLGNDVARLDDGTAQDAWDGVQGITAADDYLEDLTLRQDETEYAVESIGEWREERYGIEELGAVDADALRADIEQAQAEIADAAQDAANALTTANGMNRRRRGVTEPATPDGGWNQGDQWVRDEDRDGVMVPVQVLVWDGTEFVPEQIIADDVLVFGENGAVRIADGAVTAPALAVDALDFKTARGAQFYGGYIEAPVIASSSRLGAGVNKLADPQFSSAIDTAWVASGHLGDSGATQRDTLTWDQTWTMPNLYPPITRTYRNWGNVVADLAITPGERKTGSLVMPNYGWLTKTARSFTNPYTFKTFPDYVFGHGQVGGETDPTFRAVDSRPPTAGVERTTYLTNTALIQIQAGERWNARLKFQRLTSDTSKYISSAVIEIVDANSGVVLMSHAIAEGERIAGQVNVWFDSTQSANVHFRVKVAYTAGGLGGRMTRTTTAGSYARSAVDGGSHYEWEGSGDRKYLSYVSYPSAFNASYLGGENGGAYASRASFEWGLSEALFAQVEPSAGWRLTEGDGLELFNSLGARTALLDGETNYFSGQLATAESGERWQLAGPALELYNEYGDLVGEMRRSGPGVTTSFNTFALKSQLDSWAPIDGTHAWVTAENREYVRISGAWIVAEQHNEQALTFKSPYSTYGTQAAPSVERHGKTVFLNGVGAISNSSNLATSADMFTANLPAWARPKQTTYQICQGSSQSRWLLVVNTSGKVTGERYYPASTATNLWLPFSVSYVAAN